MTLRRPLRALTQAGLVGAMVLVFLTLLALAGATGPGNGLALALALALVPLPILFRLVLWLDRFEPEPLKALAFTFAWGATFACLVALVVNSVGQAVVSDSLGEEAGMLYGGSISAPVVEESAKGLALLLVLRTRRLIDGVLDGIVYGAMVGLGFAFTENVFYYAQGAAEQGVEGAVGTFVLRGLMSPLAHPLFTASIGIGIGLAVAARGRPLRILAPLAGLGVAMALHALWNTAAATGYFLGVYVVVFLPMLAAYAALAIFQRRREQRVLRRQLAPFVANGMLTSSDLEVLASSRERRRALQRGSRRHRRAVATYAEAATRVAFLRERCDRGRAPEEARAQEREAVERMLEAKQAALQA